VCGDENAIVRQLRLTRHRSRRKVWGMEDEKQPFQPVHPQVLAMVESMARSCEDIARPIAEFERRIAQQAQAIQDYFGQFATAAQRLTDRMADAANRWSSVFESIARSLAELPERTRKAARTLAKNGWYIDGGSDFNDIRRAVELFDNGDTAAGNAYLCEYYASRLDDIEDELTTRFPHRKNILGPAFAAHRRGEYVLSIPVFLAQADGICVELAGEQLYKRKNGTPKVAEKLGPFDADSLERAMLAGLLENHPIGFNPVERVGLVDFLNRHTVLHGESVDYGTPVNSWRAISLLEHVAWILDKVPESDDETVGAAEA
jgi:hypothetical protein